MPRVGDVMQLLSGTLAVPNTTIQSAPYNAQQQDWVLDANNPRPISAGGTGATTGTAARANLGAIGAGDLAAAATKTPVVGTDSLVIIDSEDTVSTAKNKRWLVSDFRTSLSTMTNTNFNLISTDGSSNAAPTLTLDRQSPTAATNDYLGIIRWLGRNSAEEVVPYGDMFVQITDHINNQEKSSLVFRNLINGTLGGGMTLHQTGLAVAGAIAAGTGITAESSIVGKSMVVVKSPSYSPQNIHFWFYGPADEDRGVIYTAGDTAGAITIQTSGGNAFTFGNDGVFTSGGNVTANGTVFSSPGATIIASNSNAVYLRPFGLTGSPDAFQAYLRTDGYFFAPVLYGSIGIATSGNVVANGEVQASSYFRSISGRFHSDNANMILSTPAGGTIRLRPQGTDDTTPEYRFDAANAFKPGGGSWGTISDERVKTVHGDYESGLDQILALQPVVYTYNGNDGLPPTVATGKEYIGLVAQQAEIPMPELVTQSEGYIDGVKVDDLRHLDNSPLVYALVNSTKELATRIDTLHARIKTLEEAA